MAMLGHVSDALLYCLTLCTVFIIWVEEGLVQFRLGRRLSQKLKLNKKFLSSAGFNLDPQQWQPQL